jgi:RHS repeat-associated protein
MNLNIFTMIFNRHSLSSNFSWIRFKFKHIISVWVLCLISQGVWAACSTEIPQAPPLSSIKNPYAKCNEEGDKCYVEPLFKWGSVYSSFTQSNQAPVQYFCDDFEEAIKAARHPEFCEFIGEKYIGAEILLGSPSAPPIFAFAICTGQGPAPGLPNYRGGADLAYFCPNNESAEWHSINGETNRGVFLCPVPAPPLLPEKAKDECDECGGAEGQAVGDPINPTTGNMYHDEVDYAAVGNSPLEFKRRYNSIKSKPGDGALGQQWRHSYSARLELIPTEFENNSYPYAKCENCGIVYDPNAYANISSFNSLYTFLDKNYLNLKSASLKPHTQSTGRVMTGLKMSAQILIKLQRANGRQLIARLYEQGWRADGDVSLKFHQTATGWQLVDEDGTVEAYDSQGKLLSITDRKGVKVGLSYDAANRLTQVSDPYGRTLSFVYDAAGRMVEVKNPLGRATKYSYDTNQRLAGVVYPDGTKKQYVYEVANQPSALTGIVNELGKRVATWTYDASGKATGSSNANGVDKTTITYDEQQSTVKNALGQTTTYAYTAPVLGIALTDSVTYPNGGNRREYDSNGNLIRYTDANGVSHTYTYDLSRNLPLTVTEAAGTAEQRVTINQWHATFKLPTQVTVGNLTATYSHDASGNVLSVSKKDTALNTVQTWRYQYNVAGLMTQSTDPKGIVQRYVYDAKGNIASSVNALGHSTQYTVDAAGQLLTAVAPNGNTVTYSYDVRGRKTGVVKTSRVTALSPALKESTQYRYTAAGQLSGATLPTGQTLAYMYDGAGRLVKVSDNLGNSMVYALDLIGQVKKLEVKDSAGQLSFAVNHVYDEMGNRINSVGARKNDQFAYDGLKQLVAHSDSQGNGSGFAYDGLKRMRTVSNPDGGSVSTDYTVLDQLTRVTGTLNEATQYTVTALDTRQQTVSPDTGKTVYTHDANGNVLSQTDALGNKTSYTYDALNRLTQQTDKDGTTRFTYDESFTNLPGNYNRLTRLVSPSGTQTYQYDGFGRLAQVQQTQGAVVRTTKYAYTAGGQLVTVTYPSGVKVDYQYTGGQVSAVLINGKPQLSQIKYNAVGQLVSGTFANGEKLKRTYDTSGNPTGTALATYGLDATGSIQQITTTPNAVVSMTNINQSIGITYDAMNRITDWNDTFNQKPATGTTIKTTATARYDWDTNSNRRSLNQTQSSQVNAGTVSDTSNTQDLSYGAGNRLTRNTTSQQIGTVTNNRNQAVTLDAAGNTLNDGLRAYSYTAAGRLKSLVSAGKTTQYSYDAQNRRVLKTFGTSSTAYVYAESIGEGSTALSPTSLMGEYSSTNNKDNKEYVYLGDTPIAVVQTGNVLTVQTDHLKTPRQVTDSTKKVIWNWAYSAFGENQPTTTNNTTLNLRYPGQYYDAESKLHYNINRYYDPATGRYTQSDPIGLAGGINTYTYVGGNTVGKTDKNGLQADSALMCRTIGGAWCPPEPDVRPDGRPWGAGCGDPSNDKYIPDGFGDTDFTPACEAHDKCYGTCGMPKETCDNKFYHDLERQCKIKNDVIACQSLIARAYYLAVHYRGADPYNSAQESACSCRK